MDATERRLIEQECRDLVTMLTQFGDHGEAENAVALFTEDGTWIRGGKPFKGRAALLDSYRRGSATQVTRHVGANTMITVTDDNNATGVTYYIAYHHDPKTANPTLPLPLDPPFSMGEWHDKFVRTPAGWRFSFRETRRLFQHEGSH